MKKAILTNSTNLEYYGPEADAEDKALLDDLMVEYLEKLGYEVEVRSGLEPRLELSDMDPEKDYSEIRFIHQRAWEYANEQADRKAPAKTVSAAVAPVAEWGGRGQTPK
jgi:hypothetical protein